MLALATKAQNSDIVLDFFAGSGSTADAVMQQNAEDGGNRKFVAVQLPEPTGHEDYALVSDITHARILAAIDDLGASSGLRTFRLGDSAFRTSREAGAALFDLGELTLDEGNPDLEAVAAEVLLKEGVALDEPWQRHKAGNATAVVSGQVAVVLSVEISEEAIADALALGPRVIVFLEDGFAGRDAVKANAFTQARNLGITMKTV